MSKTAVYLITCKIHTNLIESFWICTVVQFNVLCKKNVYERGFCTFTYEIKILENNYLMENTWIILNKLPVKERGREL